MGIRRFRKWLVLWPLVSWGCMPAVEQDPLPSSSAATVALFAPNTEEPCLGVVPFPTDLAKDPDTGTLKIPYCTTDTVDETAMKAGLRTLDGYAVHTAVYAYFNRPLDETTIATGVRLVQANGVSVAYTAQVVAATLPDGSSGYQLLITPDAPLAPATQYVVVVTGALEGADGTPVIADAAFSFVKSDEPVTDDHGYSNYAVLDDASANGIEMVRQGYQPLFAGLALMGIPKATVALAWTFTTQSLYTGMQQLAALAGTPEVEHDSVAGANGHPLLVAAGIPTTNVCSVHTGRVMLKNFVTPGGTFGALPSGLPYSDTVAVDYMLTTPGTGCPSFGADPDATWNYANVAVFVHGLGRCKNDMLALADTLGAYGWAVLALDGPRAGARVIDGLGDQDLDGCADQPETPELIALAGQNPNPFAVRDQLREWGLEVAQVVKLVNDEPWLFVGADEPGTEVDIRVGVVGHSWGGMAATLGGPVAATSIDAMVLSAVPSDLGAIFSPVLQAVVPAADFQATLAAFVWAMEPADPLFAVPNYPDEATNLPVLAQVIDGGSDALDAAMVESLHGVPMQTALADAFEAGGRTATITEMTWANGDTFDPICADATGVIGAMLQPCVESTEPTFGHAYDKLAAMRGELVYFLNAGVLP